MPENVDAPEASTAEEVMFYDTDIGGVVSNIAYLRFVERARSKLCGVMGISPVQSANTGRFPAVARTEIDYRRPALLGDFLDVTATVESIDRVRLWCRFEIVRRTDKVTLTNCRQQIVLVQLPEGKPVRLPAEWLETWPQLAEKDGKRNERSR